MKHRSSNDSLVKYSVDLPKLQAKQQTSLLISDAKYIHADLTLVIAV